MHSSRPSLTFRFRSSNPDNRESTRRCSPGIETKLSQSQTTGTQGSSTIDTRDRRAANDSVETKETGSNFHLETASSSARQNRFSQLAMSRHEWLASQDNQLDRVTRLSPASSTVSSLPPVSHQLAGQLAGTGDRGG